MRKLFFLGLVALLASCNKDDSNSLIDPVSKNEYFPLEIGNYWVYEDYDIDTSGNETCRNRIDSVVISGDTIIRGNQYFILKGTYCPYTWRNWGIVFILRDSAGCIVDEKGKIRFSADNFNDILGSEFAVINDDTLYTLTYHMEKVSNLITVPAGEFEVLNFKGTVTTTLQIPGIKYPRYSDCLYAKNVGKVLETYFSLYGSVVTEKRLVSYHIETR